MDAKMLETLGITKEDLIERIVGRAVNEMLSSSGFDPESDSDVSYESKFQRAIQERVQKAVDLKISQIAEIHLIPKVGQIIENLNLRRTNNYGEPKGEPMGFVEYIASRADAYMSETVNSDGKSKEESSGSFWRGSNTRVAHLVRCYIQSTLESHAKAALKDVNAVIVKGFEKAARDAITAAASAVKITVQS